MSEEEQLGIEDASSEMPRTRRGYPKLAWAVIGLLICVSLILQGQRKQAPEQKALNALQQNILDIQGQYLVGASQVPGMQKGQLYESAKALNTGPLSRRLRFVVIAGEIKGPGEAIRQADVLRKAIDESSLQASGGERRVLTVLQTLFSDYQLQRWNAPSLESDDRRLLENELGWFGDLALSPDVSGVEQGEVSSANPKRDEVLAPARRTLFIVLLTSLCGLGVGIAGLAGASILLVLVVTKRISSKLLTGREHSAVYVETFAVWMLLFLAITAVAGLFVSQFPNSRILVSSAGSLLSLAALMWPTFRGLAWRQVRQDIGWFGGGKPIRELFWGVICYVSNLPILALGLLVTLALLGLYHAITGTPGGLQSVESAPTHPVVEWVRQAGWIGRSQIVLLACLVAPLVEETVFRGVLYRHMREGTRRWSTGASIALSSGATSFIFAVIHPQGVLAVPALMAVATGLSLAREWRGSLLAPIAMHAMNNGVMMLLLFSLL